MMRLKKNIITVLLCVLLFPGLFGCSSEAFAVHQQEELHNDKKKPFVVGVFPRRNKSVTRKLFNPLIRYLEKKLNRPVILKTPRTFSLFWEDVEDRIYDLVHYNQYHYIVSNKEFGYKVIVRNKEFGKDTITSLIVVKKNRGINSIEDLRGKNIVFGGGPKAMQSYIYPRFLLKHHGLAEEEYREDFAINPPNALIALYYDKTSAAGIGDTTIQLEMVKKQIDISRLKILLRGDELPHLPWAVKNTLSTDLQQFLQTTLATLHESRQGQQILKSANIDQLVVSKNQDYDIIRQIIEHTETEMH